MWPGRVRFLSAQAALDVLEHMVSQNRQRMISIKDDTFCCDRRRVLEICHGIQRRGLRFLWNCDTRADSLDEEVLEAMCRAGCRRISIGVESAAPEILSAVRKRLSPQTVVRATDMAKMFGFDIRYYMMAGNRGETAETLETSIAFLYEARPTSFVFSILSLYPGTEEFLMAERAGQADREMFFSSDLPVFKAFFKKKGGERLLSALQWVLDHQREKEFFQYSIGQRRRILRRLPDLPAAHLELGKAMLAAGECGRAETHLRAALKMGYPLPGPVWNDLAVSAAWQGQCQRAEKRLYRAFDTWPHPLVADNLDRLHQWRRSTAPPPLQPAGHQDLDRIAAIRQPAEPGPIHPEDLPNFSIAAQSGNGTEF
jgi:hypothetical protein